jgi:chorismate mutase
VSDPVLSELRAEITEVDRRLVAALNDRLQVVDRIFRHKESNGIPLRDDGREQSMLRLLDQQNPGPLSAEGLADFYRHVLDLTKRELKRG